MPLKLAEEKGLSETVGLLKTGVPAQPGESGRERVIAPYLG